MPAFSSIALGLTVASTAVGISQQNKAARARKEGQRIQGNTEQVQSRLARRRAARQERQRRSALIASSVATGTGGSSGQLGAESAIGSNFGQAVAQQGAQTRGALGISAALQTAANAENRAASAQAFGNLVTSSINLKKTLDS